MAGVDRSDRISAVTVTLPMGIWLGVETSLKNQRYELQRFLAQKTEAPTHVRRATEQAILELNVAIDKIADVTASV